LLTVSSLGINTQTNTLDVATQPDSAFKVDAQCSCSPPLANVGQQTDLQTEGVDAVWIGMAVSEALLTDFKRRTGLASQRLFLFSISTIHFLLIFLRSDDHQAIAKTVLEICPTLVRWCPYATSCHCSSHSEVGLGLPKPSAGWYGS